MIAGSSAHQDGSLETRRKRRATQYRAAHVIRIAGHKKAERQGFEPWEPGGSLVFETSAFDHSATSPSIDVIIIGFGVRYRYLHYVRTFIKIFVFAVAGILSILAVLWLLLTTAPGESLVKDWVEEKVSDQLGLELHIARLETNLWSRVQIDTVTLASVEHDKADTILFVGHAEVTYSLLQLIGEGINLRRIAADNVVFDIVLDSLGRTGIALIDEPAPDSANAAEPTSWSVDSIDVTRIGVRFQDDRAPIKLELESGDLRGSGKSDGSTVAGFTAETVNILYDTVGFKADRFELSGAFDSTGLSLNKAEIAGPGLHLSASGHYALAPIDSLDMSAQILGYPDSAGSSLTSLLGEIGVGAGWFEISGHAYGSIAAPIVDFSATVHNAHYDRVVAPELYAEGSYADSLLRIDSLDVSLLGGHLSGTARVGLDSISTAEVSLIVDKIDLSTIWPIVYEEVSPFAGIVSGGIQATGRTSDLESWSANLGLQAGSLQYLKRPIPNLEVTAKISKGGGNVRLAHGNDKIEADIEFTNDSLSCRLRLDIPEIGALARFVDVPDLTGRMFGSGVIEGAFATPEALLDLTGSHILYQGFPVDTLTASLSYRNDLLTLNEFSCGAVMDSIDSHHPPFQIDSLSGSLWYTCSGSGSLDSIRGEATVALGHPGFGSINLDTVRLEARADGASLTVSRMFVTRGGVSAEAMGSFDTRALTGDFTASVRGAAGGDSTESNISSGDSAWLPRGTLSGQFSLERDSIIDATATIRDLWLGLLPAVTGDTTDLGGLLDCDLTFKGSAGSPHLNVTGSVTDFTIGRYRLDSVSAGGHLSNSAIVLDSLNAHALGHLMHASGYLPLTVSDSGKMVIDTASEVRAELTTTEFDLAGFSELMEPGSEVAGLASASISLFGTLDDPHVEGWLTLAEGRYRSAADSPPIEGIDLRMLFADSVATIERGRAVLLDKTVQADGSRLVVEQDRIRVHLGLLVDDIGKLTVDGAIADSTVDLAILADSLDISVVQPMLARIDSLSGTLAGRVTVRGSKAVPAVDGVLSLAGVNALMPRRAIRVSDGYVALSLRSNHVDIDSLSMLINGGLVRSNGKFDFGSEGLTDVGLTLEVKNVALQEPDYYALVVDSALVNWSSLNGNYTVSGDVVLGQVSLTARFRPNSILPWVSSLETVDMELPDLIARSRLDLRIRQSDNIWLDNNLARIRMHAEVGVIGTPLRPNFTGLIRVEEGYLIYLDRRFEVNEGTVFFVDPNRFNPDISLEASTKVTVYQRTAATPYEIFIGAKGRLDQLEYGLYSEPALDRSDIVSVLTLGATRSELTGGGDNGQGGLSDVLKDRAAMLTSQRVSGYLSRRANSLFGFDEFTISGNLFQLDKNWGPSLVASKHLTERLDLTYSTTVGHINDQSVRLGYRLTPHVSLQGETDRQGRAGLDLKYGFKFK